MLLHKRQDLATVLLGGTGMSFDKSRAQTAGFSKSRAQTTNANTLCGHQGCPLTKPTNTRIKLFKYGFWCLLSRFACGLRAGFAKSCFFIKGRI